jgi:epoxyqueuosine reductase QueG
MELHEKMPRLVRRLGGDIYGVADLTAVKEEVMRQGGEEVSGYPRAVSIGVKLMHPIVERLPERDRSAVAVAYHTHAYEVVNLRLDAIASRVASALQDAGFRAYPIPASERVEDERICAVFSHKLAAHAAGLGWIGKSCLLVTTQSGPRVRFTTVLTDAPLPATGEPLEQRCGDCRECVDACPIHAFTGRNFVPGEPREMRYDARACEKYFLDMKAQGKVPVCGMCLYACPYGKKASRELHV